jgi:hypothetical protein
MFINGLGGLATGATVVIVVLAKFKEGAWIVVLLIPALIVVMIWVAPPRLDLTGLHEPLAVVPLERWNRVSQKALRYALTVSREVHAVHVECEETAELIRCWTTCVQEPAREAGRAEPKLALRLRNHPESGRRTLVSLLPA